MEQQPIAIAPAIQPMLNVEEVAALIRMSSFTVRKYARLQKIPGAKRMGNTWMFRRNEIQKFVEGGK